LSEVELGHVLGHLSTAYHVELSLRWPSDNFSDDWLWGIRLAGSMRRFGGQDLPVAVSSRLGRRHCQVDRQAPVLAKRAQREAPMRDKSSIKFQIPVPWANSPACIEACGRHAVTVAGTVAVIIVILILVVATT
jgi:hypothetical protein